MRCIVPEYERPSAIMVPHYECDLRELLENITRRLIHSIGVILVSPDPDYTQSFVATTNHPDRLRVISAPLDTPWIHDRSPIAIRTKEQIIWSIPRFCVDHRPNDETLFSTICANPTEPTPVKSLAHGNLIAGANGLAFTSTDINRANRFQHAELNQFKKDLGISEWILFDSFELENTAHADLHVRVLREDLIAVAWNLSSADDREKTLLLEARIRQTLPGVTIIRIPIRSEHSRYASLLNWIQIDNTLLIPRYDLTPETDIQASKMLFSEHEFEVDFIQSPTLDVYGSIHCLTAAIYI